METATKSPVRSTSQLSEIDDIDAAFAQMETDNDLIVNDQEYKYTLERLASRDRLIDELNTKDPVAADDEKTTDEDIEDGELDEIDHALEDVEAQNDLVVDDAEYQDGLERLASRDRLIDELNTKDPVAPGDEKTTDEDIEDGELDEIDHALEDVEAQNDLVANDAEYAEGMQALASRDTLIDELEALSVEAPGDE